MAESRESYWSKHHWSIVQSVSGLYCAALATWERFHPVAAITKQISTPANTASPTLPIQNYSMPFWLWVGIMVLALSVIVPAAIRMIRGRGRGLQARASVLSRDIKQFIENLPPKLQLPQGSTFDQIFDNARVADNGRVEKVHHGYMHRFRHRVIALSHELAENGIPVEAEHYEIDPPEIQREEGLRHIADALDKVVASLESVKKQSLSTASKRS